MYECCFKASIISLKFALCRHQYLYVDKLSWKMLLKLVIGWAKHMILSLLMMCPLTGIVHIVGGLILLSSVIVVSRSKSYFFSNATNALDILLDLLAYLFIYLNVKSINIYIYIYKHKSHVKEHEVLPCDALLEQFLHLTFHLTS